MLLKPEIRAALLECIRLRFNEGSLDELLQTSINRKLRSITGNTGFDAQSQDVLAELERAPSQLRTFLAALCVKRPDEKGLVDRVLANLDETAPDDEQLMRIVQFGGQFFADRAGFRRAALELASDRGARVLVLCGAERVGKSHCWFFVDKLRESKGLRPVNVDLDEWGEAEVTASELAVALLSGCGIDGSKLVEDPTVQHPRAAKLLAEAIVQLLINAGGRPVWAFIDHAYRARLRKDARDLILLLARKAVINAIPGFRMIVVDPKGELGLSATVPLEVAALHAGDLIELFHDQLKGRTVVPELIEAAAREVLGFTGLDFQLGIHRALLRLWGKAS